MIGMTCRLSKIARSENEKPINNNITSENMETWIVLAAIAILIIDIVCVLTVMGGYRFNDDTDREENNNNQSKHNRQ